MFDVFFAYYVKHFVTSFDKCYVNKGCCCSIKSVITLLSDCRCLDGAERSLRSSSLTVFSLCFFLFTSVHSEGNNGLDNAVRRSILFFRLVFPLDAFIQH